MSEYQYKERSADQWRQNRERSHAGGTTFLKPEYASRVFKAVATGNSIRILPPATSWDAYGHFGLVVKRHIVGPNNDAYLCHNYDGLDAFVKGRLPGKCPICAANAAARARGDTDLSKKLYAKPAVLVWLINRNDMPGGPKLWFMPTTKIHDPIMAQAYNPKTDKALPIDSPYNGYDITFEAPVSGGFPQYGAIAVDRDPSPISENPEVVKKYLGFVEKHPLPGTLIYHSPEKMRSSLDGMGAEEAPQSAVDSDWAAGATSGSDVPYDSALDQAPEVAAQPQRAPVAPPTAHAEAAAPSNKPVPHPEGARAGVANAMKDLDVWG